MARRRRPLRDDLLNLPNLITLVRIAVIPPFLWFTWRGDPASSFIAAMIFTFAAVSDVVDGWLARRMNLVSVLGKFMDPLADKLIVTSALVLLAQMGRIEGWLVIVLLCRELIVSGLRQIAVGEGLVIAAGQGGKWKTSLQLAGIIGCITHFTYPANLVVVPVFPVRYQVLGEWLLTLSLIPSIASMVEYFSHFLRAVAAKDAQDAKETAEVQRRG